MQPNLFYIYIDTKEKVITASLNNNSSPGQFYQATQLKASAYSFPKNGNRGEISCINHSDLFLLDRPVIQSPLESFFSFFTLGISQMNILVHVKVPQVATIILIYPLKLCQEVAQAY